MKKLIVMLLLTSLTACNQSQKMFKTYGSAELDKAVEYAADCVGVTKPPYYGFMPDLGDIQGNKVWGRYYWTTDQMLIHTDVDYTKRNDSEKKQYEYYLISVVSHELTHRRQDLSGWVISPSWTLYGDRPEEQDAQNQSAICLTKYIEDDK